MLYTDNTSLVADNIQELIHFTLSNSIGIRNLVNIKNRPMLVMNKFAKKIVKAKIENNEVRLVPQSEVVKISELLSRNRMIARLNRARHFKLNHYLCSYVSEVAKVWGVTTEEIMSKRRLRKLAEARAAVYFVGRMNNNIPLKDLGRFFGNRNHSTIINGIRKTNEWLWTGEDKFTERFLEFYERTRDSHAINLSKANVSVREASKGSYKLIKETPIQGRATA